MKPGLDSPPADVQAGRLHAARATPPGAASSVSAPMINHVDRDAFSLRLQQQYHHYAVKEKPFLLIAMRGDGEAARGLDFTLLYQCVRKLLTNQDDWLVDLEHKRLIVLLAPALPVDARRFFARLKVQLLETVPHQAQAYLYAITAITVVNGAPFQTAEDFLNVALEER